MAKYALFCGRGSGKGGWLDHFLDRERVEDAVQEGIKLQTSPLWTWWHVVNLETGAMATSAKKSEESGEWERAAGKKATAAKKAAERSKK